MQSFKKYLYESIDEDSGHPGFVGIAKSMDELIESIEDGYFMLDGTNLQGIKNVDLYHKELDSLKGCPSKITGYFECSGNNLLTLKYCPSEVSSFSCSESTWLTSLKYCPIIVHGEFDCSGCSNKNFKRLTYLPKEVNGAFRIDSNIINPLIIMDVIGVTRIVHDSYRQHAFILAINIINDCITRQESMEETMDQLLQAGVEQYAVI